MNKLIFLIITFVFAASCKKHTARTISGTYSGYTYNVYFQSGSPANANDSVYGEFKVDRTKKFVHIMGNKIHHDSLADGQYIYTNGDCSSSITLSGDTLSALFCNFYNPFAYSYYGCYGVKVHD